MLLLLIKLWNSFCVQVHRALIIRNLAKRGWLCPFQPNFNWTLRILFLSLLPTFIGLPSPQEKTPELLNIGRFIWGWWRGLVRGNNLPLRWRYFCVLNIGPATLEWPRRLSAPDIPDNVGGERSKTSLLLRKLQGAMPLTICVWSPSLGEYPQHLWATQISFDVFVNTSLKETLYIL